MRYREARQQLKMSSHTNALSGNSRISLMFFGILHPGLQVRRLQESQGMSLSK
jgi:hypothetical protein